MLTRLAVGVGVVLLGCYIMWSPNQTLGQLPMSIFQSRGQPVTTVAMGQPEVVAPGVPIATAPQMSVPAGVPPAVQSQMAIPTVVPPAMQPQMTVPTVVPPTMQPQMTAPAGVPPAMQPQMTVPAVVPPAMQPQMTAPETPAGPQAPIGGRISGLSEGQSRERSLIADVRETELSLDIEPKASKIMRTRKPVGRVSVTHPNILLVTQMSPTEFELIGQAPGETSLTFWFAPMEGQGEGEMLRYLVRVGVNEAEEEELRIQYRALERKINELFPNSLVRLIPIGDKLVVRGQARDSREAGEILQLIGFDYDSVGGYGRGYGNRGAGWYGGGYGYGWGGGAGWGYGGGPGWRNGGRALDGVNRNINIVNMLDVPGEKQVLLKVRIAEVSRSALRDVGTKLNLHFGDFTLDTSLGVTGAITAVLNSEQVKLTIQALSSNGYSKTLAEPNLVTLSGHPAYFLAGGEFAVPTVVGVEGTSAATTTFRGFGTQLRFTPVVVDKDRIRLDVSPSFSSLDRTADVQGIPGLTSRAVSTTVDLREGQWLAIAGLIQDQQEGSKTRVPFLGDIPIVDFFFSKRHVKRDETELLVMVSPELVHPLEPEEAPLILPGMEITEPADCAFFIYGDYEGRPQCDHRSTVWPIIQRAGLQGRQEARQLPGYQRSAGRYVQGPHGFTY